MDLTYAQHLEDYHLASVFGDQREGFYVDVGAGHPVADNVSCWFYQRGWRGIVVEPQPRLIDLYACIRPRDIRECCVLGAAPGEVDFHDVERLHGFSTIVPQFAESAVGFGARYETRKVPMKTLAGLCEAHGAPRIDFLKVDVEGAEAQVLAGVDWTRHRPRVVLCEALAPGSLAENWQDWEPYLIERNYEFVLFDGLNRFYVDRADTDLLARFPRQKAEWLVVPHLGHTNRAPFRDDHPDHDFAKALTGAFLAMLPKLGREELLALAMHGEPCDPDAPLTAQDKARIIAKIFPGEKFAQESVGARSIDAPTVRDYYRALIDSDDFRILTGRLSMSYDGGQILD
jgi:FkbM family methyltransferase